MDEQRPKNRLQAIDLVAVHDSIEWIQSNLQILSPQQLIQELEIIKMWVKNNLAENKIEHGKPNREKPHRAD